MSKATSGQVTLCITGSKLVGRFPGWSASPPSSVLDQSPSVISCDQIVSQINPPGVDHINRKQSRMLSIVTRKLTCMEIRTSQS